MQQQVVGVLSSNSETFSDDPTHYLTVNDSNKPLESVTDYLKIYQIHVRQLWQTVLNLNVSCTSRLRLFFFLKLGINGSVQEIYFLLHLAPLWFDFSISVKCVLGWGCTMV